MYRISCIGAGVMGTSLMKAAASAGGAVIGFSDHNPAKAQAAAQAVGGVAYATNQEAALACDMVFLAVKPRALADALAEIAPVVARRAAGREAPPLLVSMAAGWSIARIREVCAAAPEAGGAAAWDAAPLVRIMPNTPALIGQGVIALAASPQTPQARIAELERLLAPAGLVERVDESLFDAVTALSGSGPAFAYLFIEALADGAVRAGLDRARALRYAARTVQGAAALAGESGKHPGELKDAVCSPGGTTIAGVAALEDRAFRAAVMSAVDAAYRRAQELGAS